jgi:hypothetical protein
VLILTDEQAVIVASAAAAMMALMVFIIGPIDRCEWVLESLYHPKFNQYNMLLDITLVCYRIVMENRDSIGCAFSLWYKFKSSINKGLCVAI